MINSITDDGTFSMSATKTFNGNKSIGLFKTIVNSEPFSKACSYQRKLKTRNETRVRLAMNGVKHIQDLSMLQV